jgi:hypothetical protein
MGSKPERGIGETHSAATLSVVGGKIALYYYLKG